MSELGKGAQLAGRYTLKQQLGGGGEASTWLASDRMTGASVTLKIVTSGDAGARRLREEWRTGIRLMHAHVGRVFEFHDDERAVFYSRQYIDGPDIGVLAGAPLEHLLAPIGLIADALSYAHGRDIVHRDVKAANVLLDANGAPYLIDFGVASTAGKAAHGGSLISSSPQSLAGEPAQPADDVFALGGLIYELVSGHSPYSSATTEADIRERVPQPLRRADGSAVPEAVRDLVARMLHKDAAARPTASDVVAELAAAGFSAGAAPKRYAEGKARSSDELIEAKQAIAPRRRAEIPAPQPAGETAGGGLSARTVGIAFAVLMVVLLGVVFLLPSKVDDDRGRSVEEPDEERAPTVAEEGAPGALPLEGDEEAQFSENLDEVQGRDARLRARSEAEEVLGELLSHMETLESRGVQRWGGTRFADGVAAYEAGDAAYLEKNYELAAKRYREAKEILEPLIGEVDTVFDQTMIDARAAFDAGDTVEAVRLYDLAVAISPNDADATREYERAKNLDTVLSLVSQGMEYEKNLELDAAFESFERAATLDPEWQAAQDGMERVRLALRQMEFDQRMTEGLLALEQGDYPSARAAFTMAKQLKPESTEPADGLLQVELGMKLGGISRLEQEAYSLESTEQWAEAATTYEKILGIDGNLSFAKDGLRRAREMEALHRQLSGYIDDPDVLSNPSTMQTATKLVVDITRMPDIGPRLEDKRNELSRLLKRAATPLTVELVSDNLTDVSIYRVGKLGAFSSQQLKLRPGTYVAVGSRPGYRDVRLEFRVAPEIEMRPIIVRCEEPI